jgi:hypothetical protein
MSDYEYNFKRALEILLELDILDGVNKDASVGVALQIINQGVDSLKGKQVGVYNHSLCNEIESLQKCTKCECEIPLEDLPNAYEYDADSFMCVDCREEDSRLNNV